LSRVGSPMGRFRFEKNATVIFEGRQWRLRRKRGTCWQLENISDGEIIEKEEQDLFSMHFHGQLRGVVAAGANRGVVTVRELSDAEKDEVQWRLSFVKAAYDLPVTESVFNIAITEGMKNYDKHRQSRLESTAAKSGHIFLKKHDKTPNWTTVYRWLIRYKESGDDAHALIRKERGDSDKTDSRLNEIIEDAIDEEYLTRERNPLQDAINIAQHKTKDENAKREKLGISLLKLPSRRDVQRRLELMPKFDIYAARYGRQAAMTKFRAVKGHVITGAILQRVEIDHTPLDLFVVDDETGIPLGRPYLTMCIDDFSRCVLGMYIGFIPPSYQSVALCLKHAFFPKVDMKTDYPEVEQPWIAFGLMRNLIVDQGSEFHSEALEEACKRLGINIEYAPRKTGWYKGKIERFLGRMNREIAHGTRGTTFSNIFERGDYNPEKFATVRLSTLKLGCNMWVCDVYHTKPHHALDMPPAMMWELNTATEDIPFPHERNVLEIIMGCPHDKTLTHKGIEYEGLQYGGEALHALRQQYGAKLPVQIKVNESDIGTIYVLYEGEVVISKALRFDYANGLSLWLHKQIKANTPKYDCDSWKEGLVRLKELFRNEEKVLRGLPRRGKGRTIESVRLPKSSKETALLPAPQPLDVHTFVAQGLEYSAQQ
jgi:putative transposase